MNLEIDRRRMLIPPRDSLSSFCRIMAFSSAPSSKIECNAQLGQTTFGHKRGPSISSWFISARRGIAPDLHRVAGCARNALVREIYLFAQNKTAGHLCTSKSESVPVCWLALGANMSMDEDGSEMLASLLSSKKSQDGLSFTGFEES